MRRWLFFLLVIVAGCGRNEADPPVPQAPSGTGQSQRGGADSLRATAGIDHLAASPSGVIVGAVTANPGAPAGWSIAVWNYASGRRLLTIKAPENVLRLAVSPDGSAIAAICGPPASPTLRAWGTKTGAPLGQPRDLRAMWTGELVSSESFLSFAADGKTAVYGHGNLVSRCRPEGDSVPGAVVTLAEKPREVRQARYLPAPDQVALTTAAGALTVFKRDGESAHASRYGEAGASRQALGATFDGKRLAWGHASRDGKEWVVDLFDTSKWERVGKSITFPTGDREVLGEIAMSPTGDRVAALFVDLPKGQFEIELWSTESKRVAHLTAAAGAPSGSFGRMTFSPDGKALLVPCARRPLRVFDATTGAEQ